MISVKTNTATKIIRPHDAPMGKLLRIVSSPVPCYSGRICVKRRFGRDTILVGLNGEDWWQDLGDLASDFKVAVLPSSEKVTLSND